jgi:hypothetical protein
MTMPKVTQDYEWLKKSDVLCKWNDPAIEDFNEEDREIMTQQTYEILSIAYEDDNDTIYDDTIILIGNQYSEVEVYANELEEVDDMQKQLISEINKLGDLCIEMTDSINSIHNIVGFNKMENKKTFIDNEEVTSEMLDEWFQMVEKIKHFCIF